MVVSLLLSVAFTVDSKVGSPEGEMVVVVVEVVVVTLGNNGAAVSIIGTLLIVAAVTAVVPVPRMTTGITYVVLG